MSFRFSERDVHVPVIVFLTCSDSMVNVDKASSMACVRVEQVF